MQKNKQRIDTAIGFIGAGGIASALAKGFCGADGFEGKIYVYDINPERTGALKDLYPDKIFAVKSNQELIGNAEIIFPALIPDVLRKTAPSLKFRKENRIVHLAAGIKLAEACPWFEPAVSVARAVPLPFAAERIGPVVLFGKDPEIREVLALLGVVVEVSSERELEILASITGMMVPYYALVGETIKWGMSKGADFQGALRYAASMNEALSVLMRDKCTEDMEAFLAENTTPGGVNELGLKIMRDADAYAPWVKALEQIGKRYGL